MNKIMNGCYVRTVFLALIALGLSACVHTAGDGASGKPVDIPVIVEFDSTSNCPKAPSPGATIPIGYANRGDKLVFQSDPPNQDYLITFSPAAGKLHLSKDGKVTVPLNPRALPGRALPRYSAQTDFTFKYSISAPNCPQIDPMVIIRR